MINKFDVVIDIEYLIFGMRLKMKFDLANTLANINSKADWIGLRQVSETSTTKIFRDGKPQHNHRSHSNGIMVEVMVKGQIGYCATNRLEQHSIQEAVDIAYQQALHASDWGIHRFDHQIRPATQGKYQSPVTDSAHLLADKELNELLVAICQNLKVSEKVVKASAMAQISDIRHHFVTSNGADIEQLFSLVATDYSATAQEANIVQKRTDNGMLARCYQAGKEIFAPQTTLNRAKQIGEEAVELLFAEECPDITTDLVLAPDQMMLQIHESIGHPL